RDVPRAASCGAPQDLLGHDPGDLTRGVAEPEARARHLLGNLRADVGEGPLRVRARLADQSLLLGFRLAEHLLHVALRLALRLVERRRMLCPQAFGLRLDRTGLQIGRASCRERVWG